jgi:hypothetical protein
MIAACRSAKPLRLLIDSNFAQTVQLLVSWGVPDVS